MKDDKEFQQLFHGGGDGHLASLAKSEMHVTTLPFDSGKYKVPLWHVSAYARDRTAAAYTPRDKTEWDSSTYPAQLKLDEAQKALRNLRIKKDKVGVLVVSGLHGHEMDAPLGVREFVERLLAHRGAQLGLLPANAPAPKPLLAGAQPTPAQLTQIFDRVDLFVVPLAIPAHRYTRPDVATGHFVGTELFEDMTNPNRNFDFLRDPAKYFRSGVTPNVNTGGIGPAPYHYDEIRNLTALIWTLPIQVVIDVHTDQEPSIVYPWGWEDSTATPGIAPASNRQFGPNHGPQKLADGLGNRYREYAGLLAEMAALAGRMAAAANAAVTAKDFPAPAKNAPTIPVRYRTGHAYNMQAGQVPLAGCLDDYAVSLDPERMLAFTVERKMRHAAADPFGDEASYPNEIAAMLYSALVWIADKAPTLARPRRAPPCE